ncbi:MAG: LutC/YkgG family protein [Thermodesulfobacteriota bacterium]|jgi:L-lactate dehydrogenase complex protein LldG
MSSTNAREAILSRLGAARKAAPVPLDPRMAWSAPETGSSQRVDVFARRMEAVGTQVLRAPLGQWKKALAGVLKEKKPATVAYGPGAWFAKDLASMLGRDGLPEGRPFAAQAEDFRDELFTLDASVTSARAGIAENGALLVVPDPGEPRLLSLVPPLHVVLLKATGILSTFAGAIALMDPASGMPANALLITGPSKTADIELTLAFGVHGPKELTVIILE